MHARAVAREGAAEAERYSARPGHSEHQTGLAVDFGSTTDAGCTLRDCFADTPEAQWLAAHAGAYGFLLRYRPEDTAVTGYAAESWHYRWVGVDLVQQMAQRGVTTLEAFFGVSGGPQYA